MNDEMHGPNPGALKVEMSVVMRARELVRLALEGRRADFCDRIDDIPDDDLRDILVGTVIYAADCIAALVGDDEAALTFAVRAEADLLGRLNEIGGAK